MPEVREKMISVPAVFVRYSLMVGYGLGFLLLRKWGVYLAVLAVTTNWVVFYAVYSGASVLSPVWASLLGPLIIGFIVYRSWGALE